MKRSQVPNTEIHSPRLSEELEDRLRPSRYLGYDRDHLGVAMLRREMLDLAESQFRRAIWLNPHEIGFKRHLAWCLHLMEREDEAIVVIREVTDKIPDDPDSSAILARINEALQDRIIRHQRSSKLK